jgi:hypothetical protein
MLIAKTKLARIVVLQAIVITIINYNHVIPIFYHTAAAECQSLNHVKVKMLVRLSGKHCLADALWCKVMRVPISPKLFCTS